MDNIVELAPFNTACDEFISGKYILADIKISHILRRINEDEKLRDIVSSCLNNYNFTDAFERSVVQEGELAHLTLPTDEKDVIAYVFNILYRIDAKSLNLYDFLSNYFSEPEEGSGKEFYDFANSFIIPFKQAINEVYKRRYVISNSVDYQSDCYNKIKATIKIIVNKIDEYKLKMNEHEEFTMLLNSLFIACEHSDKKLVYSMMIALDYFARCNKRTRIAYQMLEECFG